MYMLQRYFSDLTFLHELDDVQPVDITPAAQWLLAEDPRATYNYVKDFPCPVPPWQHTWMEYTMPAQYRVGDKVIPLQQLAGLGVGGFMLSIRIPEETRAAAMRDDVFLAGAIHTTGITPLRDDVIERKRRLLATLARGTQPAWICAITVVRELPDHSVAPWNFSIYGLDEAGNYAPDTKVSSRLSDTRDINDNVLTEDLFPFWFALSLLNCRNVHTVDAPAPDAKVIAKRQRRGIPHLIFKTLVVEPTHTKRASHPPASSPTRPLAFHLVPGHFKDFAEGKGLFGKWHGRYWWEGQARGSFEAGSIAKNYLTKPQKNK